VYAIYDPIIDDLEACGFNESGKPKTLYVFPYDWRKSNYTAAALLADTIDRIRVEHSGDLKITIIAHSMGGLVSRCYLESGDFDTRPGMACVSLLVTIGTPHRGATAAALYAAGLEKKLFLSASQVHQLAGDSRYPSVYELLPPEGERFAWPYEESTALAALNIYDGTTADAIGLVDANLRAAQAFHAKLNPARRPAHVRYFAFYGTRLNTAVHIRLKADGKVLRTSAVRVDDAGDGTVPVWSTLPGIQSLPVGQEHMKLFRDRTLRSTLAILLGAAGTLAAPAQVQVVANERVVETDAAVFVALLFPGGATAIDGAVRWVSHAADGSESQPAGDAGTVQYSGAPVDKINLQLESPPYPGYYRIEYVDAAGTPAVPDEIVVQEKAA
jgi:pimeloyl-ACP methyl ester carboxylesterase